MDGRGRALDNVFVERLWRSVKQEEVYIKDYQTMGEAVGGLDRYFDFYTQRASCGQPPTVAPVAGLQDPSSGLLADLSISAD